MAILNLIVYFSKKITVIYNDTQKHSVKTVFLCLLLMLFSICSSAQVSQIQGPRNSTQIYSGVVYGPIDSNDTLWGIASRYKQGSQFSVYQTMYAIYELNPQAFENGNFNKMVSGAILQLPSDSYISRIDPNIAREKALNDERRATNNRSNRTAATQTTAPTTVSTPSESNVVSQNELSDSQRDLQKELSALRSQQQQQFELLKEQVSDSIKSVQILLEENKQLSEQLKMIDENNRTLTESVESQLQMQIDEQMAQLSEIVALVKAAEEQKLQQNEGSILHFLASPISIIIIMSVVTITLLVGLALLLLKRTSPQVHENKPLQNTMDATNDIVDDDLVIGEVDNAIDNDSDELLAALSENTNDDDILSDELASDEALENLDDDLLTDELDSLDDMLVPDNPDLSVAEDDKIDEFDIDDDVEDLTDNNEPIVTESLAETTQSSSDKGPQNELALSKAEPDNEDGTPSGIELNDNGEIDDKTLSQIEEQIEQKDATINELADDIIAQLDSGEPGDDQQSEPESKVSDIIIDDLTSQEDDVVEDLTTQDNKQQGNESPDLELDQLSDDLLNELTEQSKESDELDDLLTNLSDFDDDDLSLDNDETPFSESKDAKENKESLDNLDEDTLSAGSLQELEKSGDLTEHQDELSQSNAYKTSLEPGIDEDDFLNDIPSFTSDLSQSDAQKEELSPENSLPNEELEKDEIVDETSKKETLESQEQLNTNPTEENKRKIDSDEDVLSSLPDLDNWVDEKTDTSISDDQQNESSDELDLSALELDVDDLVLSDDNFSADLTTEDDILSELDDNDFDDMLSELSREDSSNLSSELANSNLKVSSPFEEAGLDLEQLTAESGLKESEFLDVDDLIKESESSRVLTDDELVLDLEKSLGNLTFGENSSELDEASYNEIESSNDQSGNLDLAQVYIDMEDVEAASELLQQVIKNGNEEERQEAKSLLASIINN